MKGLTPEITGWLASPVDGRVRSKFKRKENAKALIISRRCDGNSGVFARNTTGFQFSERRPLQACEALPQTRRIASSKDARAQKTGTN